MAETRPVYLREALDHPDTTDGVYVGDRETDIRAAENAGLDDVYLRRDHDATVELTVEPAAEIGGLDELRPLLRRTDGPSS